MKTFVNSNFHMYTEIIFGEDTESKVAESIRKYGGTKILFVYGSGSIKNQGLYGRIVDSLNDGGLPFVEFGGIKANPLRSVAEKGISLAKEKGVDFVLGVGGASVIDTAKSIALAIANNGECWSFFNGAEPQIMAPVGAINTISAAGSETSGSVVLVDDVDTGLKKGLLYNACRPKFAIMNPALTYSVSKYQTAAGGSDAISHVFLRFFNLDASHLGDEYCISTFRTIRKYIPIAIADPANYEARAELMYASTFAHNDLMGIGRQFGRGGGEHALEHQLSGYYDTAHGAGLAVMMPAFLKYIVLHGTPEQVGRVALFGVRVFDVEPDMEDIRKVAEEGIERFISWLASIEMPVTLRELGMPETDLQAAIDRCVIDTGGQINGYMKLQEKEIAEIYRLAL